MSQSESKWGYCRNCVKNVPHVEWHASPWFRFLDDLTFRKLRLVRIGPWHCAHCQNQSYYLRPTLEDAVDYPVEAVDTDSHDDLELEAARAPSVGNYIRSDKSLVVRTQRLKRFSEKYRDAVVRRILKGTTSPAQIRQEMDLSETELIDWIADLFERQQAKLEALENAAQSLLSLRIADGTPDPAVSADSLPAGVTVEGHVRPK